MTKPFLLCLLFISFLPLCYGQGDSVRVFGHTSLVPGIYKSFEEFANNAPSITETEKLSVTRLVKSKDDSTVLGAFCSQADSNQKLKGSVWGFCDGTCIYVKYDNHFPLSVHLGRVPYWKLECVGPYSYFNVVSKEVALVGPGALKLLTGALSFASSPKLDCFVITPKGKITYADVLSTERYLAGQSSLQKAFQKEAEPYYAYDYGTTLEPETDDVLNAKFALVKTYLLRLNELLTNGTKK